MLQTNAANQTQVDRMHDGAGKRAVHCSLLALLVSGIGCNGPLNLERWGGGTFGQGDINRQASRAVFFDPYPFNDIGPEVVGGRPREFARPLPEAERNKLERPNIGQQNRILIPGYSVPPGQPIPLPSGAIAPNPYGTGVVPVVPNASPVPNTPIYQQPVAPNNGGYILPQFGQPQF